MAKYRFETSCKLGTMPALVRLHGRDKVEVGRVVRVETRLNAGWQSVIVQRVDANGYFQADRYTGFAPAQAAQPPLGSFIYSE